jgi:hypothetical protein
MVDFSDMLFKQWEKGFSTFMDQLVRNQAFLTQMGKLMEGSNLFRMVVDRSIIKALESIQLPTRKDMEDALAAIRRIEVEQQKLATRLDLLQDSLTAMTEAMATLGRVAVDTAEASGCRNQKDMGDAEAAPSKPKKKKKG